MIYILISFLSIFISWVLKQWSELILLIIKKRPIDLCSKCFSFWTTLIMLIITFLGFHKYIIIFGLASLVSFIIKKTEELWTE